VFSRARGKRSQCYFFFSGADIPLERLPYAALGVVPSGFRAPNHGDARTIRAPNLENGDSARPFDRALSDQMPRTTRATDVIAARYAFRPLNPLTDTLGLLLIVFRGIFVSPVRGTAPIDRPAAFRPRPRLLPQPPVGALAPVPPSLTAGPLAIGTHSERTAHPHLPSEKKSESGKRAKLAEATQGRKGCFMQWVGRGDHEDLWSRAAPSEKPIQLPGSCEHLIVTRVHLDSDIYRCSITDVVDRRIS